MKKYSTIRYLVYFSILLFEFMPYKSIGDDLKEYSNEIILIIKDNCKANQYYWPSKVKIEFGELHDTEIGLCETGFRTFKITISAKYWKRAAEEEKFSLIAHELTHCMLGIDHSPNPFDYMYPYADSIMSKETVINQLLSYIRNACIK